MDMYRLFFITFVKSFKAALDLLTVYHNLSNL